MMVGRTPMESAERGLRNEYKVDGERLARWAENEGKGWTVLKHENADSERTAARIVTVGAALESWDRELQNEYRVDRVVTAG
jgi:hypothetical protein